MVRLRSLVTSHKGEQVPVVVVGNKIDLERKRNVDREMAEEFAASVNAKHVHTSAKNNEGIENLFQSLAETITRLRDRTGPEVSTRRFSQYSDTLTVMSF